MPRRTTEFQTIRSEGGLLPPDLLRRVVDPAGKVSGVEPAAYGLPAGERLNEAITQSWNRLRRHWAEFRAAVPPTSLDSRPSLPGEAFTGLTNDKWSLPLLREFGFGFLTATAAPAIDGKTYAISRFAGNAAIHLVGCGVSLDRRAAGVRGAAQSNPHGLVQEFLNRSPGHLWAIVSNGLSFRILRDNQALSRQSFLEFDLEAMFDGEVYSDFVLLWLVAHATRFLPRNDGRPDSCWLETWSKEAAEQGVAALTDLRGGVEKALEILGQGFVSHPQNTALREALRQGGVKLPDFHGQLLRIVYRLIFLFVAEDRELEGISLLHPQDKSDPARLAREHYATYYSTSRLRELASRIKGSRHGDLWRQFNLLVGALSGDDRFAALRGALAMPSLGSMLWNPASTALLNGPGLSLDSRPSSLASGVELSNVDFLEALRHLAFIRKDKILRPVDYKNLGSEEFGGVYESFLALTPQISGDGARFTFAEFAGSERKTSGSYYTPDSLVQCLLDSALDPVVQERLAGKTGKEAEKALLAIKVCDKACGSGHFLVGAAHRLARHLARVRALAQGESEPSPLLYQTALRDVIGHCLYGVDINPMSVELCKVTLWLEAMEPGKPLSFLDHHIRCGNSLLGATPELISAGLPDETFEAIEGDDKAACSSLKKLNRAQRESLRHLFIAEDNAIRDRLRQTAAAIDEMSDSRAEDIQRKEAAFRNAQSNYDFQKAWDLADLWCAAFVIKKHFPESAVSNSAIPNPQPAISAAPSAVQPGLFGGTEESPKAKRALVSRLSSLVPPIGITTQHLRDFVEGGALPDGLLAEAKRLAGQYHFFHWHLAFPEVFAQGGFDVSLGNPPWDQIQLDPREFFAARQIEIADAPNMAARNRMIAKLAVDAPTAFAFYKEAEREISSVQHFIHASGRFPFSSVGRLNTAPCFTELARAVLRPRGRAGLIVPSGIATDSFTQGFFRELFFKKSLISLFDFENRLGLFENVHSSLKFCLMTLTGVGGQALDSEFAFFAREPNDLREADCKFTLSDADLSLLNPNTNTCPTFRSRSDAELTKHFYRRVPVFVAEGKDHGDPWNTHFLLMFMMNTDSSRFKKPCELCMPLPLYEAKMLGFYDHRAADVVLSETALIRQGQSDELSSTEKEDPLRFPNPRYWVEHSAVDERLRQTDTEGRVVWEWRSSWLLGWRDVTSPTNFRTTLPTIIPRVGVGHKFPLMLPGDESAPLAACLLANLSSFVLDYIARQKIGGTSLTYFYIKQFPVLAPKDYEKTSGWWGGMQTLLRWLLPRVLELTYTAWDLEAFAQDCGWSGPPFRWDEERRFLLRCELDAAFFHLYLGTEDEWCQQPAALTQAFPTPRTAVSYIMDTFPIVKRKDEAKFNGDYRTKRVILEIYDALAASMQTGQPYQTRLDPPPADPRCCHPPRK